MASTVWRGRLAFGMVSIPVRLYKAARRERIRFHHVYRPVQSEQLVDFGHEDESPAPTPPKGNTREFPFQAPVSETPAEESVVRVRNLPVSETTNAPVDTPRVLKGYEIEKDRYVTSSRTKYARCGPKLPRS